MKKSNHRYSALSIAIAVAVSGGLSVSALAAEEEQSLKGIEKIAVVGSRAAPRSIGDSPVPIDIIGGDELRKSANPDMLEVLKASVPSLNVHTNPISDAATLVRPANLRGLSADSTLVLLNGKRRHRSSVITFLGGGINDGSHGPDISVIPAIAMKQVEVLRDGAAAQYGSDAIAGVINFVLKDDADGGTIEAKAGQYYEGDGDTVVVSANVGTKLTDAGFANFSAQYKNADATSRSVQRPDAAAFKAAGLPVADPAQVWGSPEIKNDVTLWANLGLDLDLYQQAYLFGNYSEREVKGGFYYRNPNTRGGVYGGPTLEDGTETILTADLNPGATDNSRCPIVPIVDGIPDANALNALQEANCFAFNLILPGGFTPNFGGKIKDTSLTAGSKGEFQINWIKGINYDFSASYGNNESRYFIFNTVNASLGPDTPMEFSPGKYEQQEYNFNADFVKFADIGLAAETAFAFGLEWHEETFTVVAGEEASWQVGPLTQQGFGIGSNGFPGFQPAAAGEFTRRNWAAYIDTDLQFTDNFFAEVAIRYEDYATFGNTTNYKVAANYSITDDLKIRASYNTGFRAPTVGQANVANVQTALSNGELVDSALLPPTNPIAVQLGGKALQPEESKSFTGGLVYNYNDFFLTVDYYNIKVENRISQSERIDLTDEDKRILKEAGVPNVDGLSQVSFFTNDFDTTTQGVDIVANYSAELLGGASAFTLAYNWNETKVDRFTEITGAFKVSRLENDLPNHRGTATWAQNWDSFGAYLRGNYYGPYQGVHIDDSTATKNAKAAITLDAEVSYFISDSWTVAVGAQNLLNQQAEELDHAEKLGLPNNAFGGKYYETSPFGFNGGFYYLRGIYNF
ncbi:TonB-dependent receptor plug domain-containing protein [Paraferrimonas sedimenticola]|uniref:Ligand-gated channel n=1 Tax=Paraferrimonas sedimenticola TaxID=375674 RepID=A0AA37RUH9_9GAMM|nr:TonB-dependent receptor [Paraferrimonas sedimenticola]GLP94777.1 ligand-gated channel [Paraferrimonas sedimenticola]